MEESSLIKPDIINDEMLFLIIHKIIEVIDPEQIILFGSYAQGNYDHTSDLDLAVIVNNSSEVRYRRAIPIRLALSKIIFPMDVVVFTKQEIEDWAGVRQAFSSTIMETGKVIYDKYKKKFDRILD